MDDPTPRTQASKIPRGAVRLAMGFFAAALISAAAAPADWLVTHNGERIETRGAWEERGRMVVFTLPGGTLSSMRLSEVDLAASRRETAEAALPAPEPPPADTTPQTVRRRPIRVITTDDIGTGTAGVEGADLLVERLRQAHRFQDVPLAMGLVHWEDVPEGIRDHIETRFEWMMQRRIRDIRYVSSEDPEEPLEEFQDDVLYETNLAVVGQIEIDFVPDPDVDQLSLTFQVGRLLGSYFLAAPREAADQPG